MQASQAQKDLRALLVKLVKKETSVLVVSKDHRVELDLKDKMVCLELMGKTAILVFRA